MLQTLPPKLTNNIKTNQQTKIQITRPLQTEAIFLINTIHKLQNATNTKTKLKPQKHNPHETQPQQLQLALSTTASIALSTEPITGEGFY
jgi:hypothetical protein